MRLSVIIPAYNAAGSLAGCLDSVTGSGAEVTVVDDGSVDGTADVVREYPGVILLSQGNRGVSAARNAGMNVATGDFLVFVDADDTVFPQALERLEASLDSLEADIIVMRSLCGREERYSWQGRFREGEYLTGKEIGMSGYVRGSVCGCAFKRSYLEENGLHFDERLSNAEDTVFFARALAAGGCVVFKDIAFYCIDPRPDSASRNLDAGVMERLGRALDAASRGIGDPVLRTRTCLSIMHGITDAGIRTGLSPARVKSMASLDSVFPLDTEGLGKARLVSVLIRYAYPLFYRLKQARMMLRK